MPQKKNPTQEDRERAEESKVCGNCPPCVANGAKATVSECERENRSKVVAEVYCDHDGAPRVALTDEEQWRDHEWKGPVPLVLEATLVEATRISPAMNATKEAESLVGADAVTIQKKLAAFWIEGKGWGLQKVEQARQEGKEEYRRGWNDREAEFMERAENIVGERTTAAFTGRITEEELKGKVEQARQEGDKAGYKRACNNISEFDECVAAPEAIEEAVRTSRAEAVETIAETLADSYRRGARETCAANVRFLREKANNRRKYETEAHIGDYIDALADEVENENIERRTP